MSTLAVELVDVGLVAAGHRGLVGAPSPGYAHLDGTTIVTGTAALERSRIEPRRIHNRFWDQLDATALVPPFPSSFTHADLAHGHLADYWAGIGDGFESVILAVPSNFTGQQLGMLLGVARACEVPVEGLVDEAVAAAATLGEENEAERLLHVDLLLHRAVVTEVVRSRRLVRTRVRVADEMGLVGLNDLWARTAAEAFVRQTRFDPLHLAESDQELYDRLPLWLELLADRPSAMASLPARPRERVAELGRAEILATAEPAYGHLAEVLRPLVAGETPATILLTARAGRMPGLAERLAGTVDGRLTVLETGAAALGAWRRRAAIRAPGESLSLVTRLALSTAPPAAARAAPTTPAPPSPGPVSADPTHLLHESRAHPIVEEPLVVGLVEAEGDRSLVLRGPTAGVSRRHCTVRRMDDGVTVVDHSTWGTFVNGRRVDGRARLAVGDRLRVGSPGIELELIAVEGVDGEA